MLSKIVRSNGTEIENIQSVTYSETVNAGESLRPGCVASAYINVNVYGADAPNEGEALRYYQVDQDNNDILIGTFYAQPSVPAYGMYSFVAYDAVSKLDTDFSARLETLQFPMTVYDLVSEACSVAGVTLGSASWPMSTMQVNAFYADHLTCRNILQYAAEIACRFVRCDVNGNVLFDWYTTNTEWSIYPGGADEDKVAYRLGGLTYDRSNVESIDSIVIRSVGEYGTQYTYPEYNPDISAEDPDSDGNVTMLNVTVTDSGDGHLLIMAKADDPNRDGNVTIEDGASAENSLTIANNLLLTDATEATYVSVAQNILSTMIALPPYRFAEVQLFPNENPFRSGEFVSVTDAQGITFTTPVFTMTVSPNGASIRSSGTVTYKPSETTTTAKEIASNTNGITRLDKLKVNWAEIDTAVVNSLRANGINANWINAGRVGLEYLKLYGAMNVYRSETFTTANLGGQIGFTSGNASSNIEQGIVQVSQNYYGVCIVGNNEVFIGFHAANDPWWDGGDIKINDGNYFNHLSFTNDSLTGDGIAELSASIIDLVCDTFSVNNRNVLSEIGNLSSLSTTAKSSLVAAINEVDESTPKIIWTNSDPSTGMAAQTLTLDADMSPYNMFFVEIAWTNNTSNRRAGTWVYVGDNETIVACPSVSSTASSALTYVYRYITIDKSNNTISIANGQRANTSGIAASNNYAIPTKILAMKV